MFLGIFRETSRIHVQLSFLAIHKKVVSLAPVRICHALVRTQITNESNFSDGQSYCQGVLEVSDL